MRPIFQVALLFSVVTCVAGCSRANETKRAARDDFGGRLFQEVAWDTVLRVGMADPNDTTLLSPLRLRVSSGRIFVIDNTHQNLRALDQSTGELLWSYTKRGQGPAEIANVVGVQPMSNGDVWLLDAGNGKLMLLNDDGVLKLTHSFDDVGYRPGRFLVTDASVMLIGQRPPEAWIHMDPETLEVTERGPLPWPKPLDERLNIRVSTAVSHTAEDQLWVLAYYFGPGFLVGRGDSVVAHYFIEPINFPLKSGPSVRAVGADSARYAGRAVSIVGDEIYILFGGRPERSVHSGADTFIIDVYGVDGGYRHSLRLPGDTWSMDTLDGRTFYVLADGGGVPVLLGLTRRSLK